ncbi:MAG TPA: type II toxin-antitoxin system Phd/YefM family antitoxin [Solirubrobacteraceae bacterium]|jgi:prevent-host-death family protein
MATVTVRDLSRNTSSIISDVVKTQKPTIVTKHGAPVVVVMAINPGDLEDLVLSKAPQFLQDYKDAEDDARNGRTVDADEFFDQLDLENS